MSLGMLDVGDQPRILGNFDDTAGNATDPTTITFIMREPDGTETTYINGTDVELSRISAGRFYVDWSITQEGTHFWRWVGTGTLKASVEGSFTARVQRVGA